MRERETGDFDSASIVSDYRREIMLCDRAELLHDPRALSELGGSWGRAAASELLLDWYAVA